MKKEGRAEGGRGGSSVRTFPITGAWWSVRRSGLTERDVTAPPEDVPSSGSPLGFCITRAALGERKKRFGRRLGSLISTETLPELDFRPLPVASSTGGKFSEPL